MEDMKRDATVGAGASIPKSEQLIDWSDEFPATDQEKAAAAAETQKSAPATETREKLDPEKAVGDTDKR